MRIAGRDTPASQVDIGARTRRRVTRRLLPFLMLVYLLAYVDRANLSVAKLQMQGALHFTDAVIGFGAGIFFVGYFLLEVPGTLIVERWSARKWLARIMISWGFIAALTGFVGTPLLGHFSETRQFYAVRFALGAAEAGFFPGVIVYLSHWFRLEDRARAKAYFMITQPIALVIGLPLSRWIMESVHWQGLAGWRWLFILEGFPSVMLGIVTLFFLTDRPEQANWLSDEEKSWLTGNLKDEELRKIAQRRVSIKDALRQPKTLLLIAIYFLIVSGNQGLIFFFPSITENMTSMSVAARTTVTILPYLFAIGGILLNGFSAARSGERRWHTALPMFLNGIALSLAILSGDHFALAIAFFCLAGAASLAYLPVFWTLPTGFLGKSAAAVAIGLINSFGNLGGFLGPFLFGYLRTVTGHFDAGLWCLTACTLMAGSLALVIRGTGNRSGHNQVESHAEKD